MYFVNLPSLPSMSRLTLPLVWSSKVIAILHSYPFWLHIKVFGARWTKFWEENMFFCPIWLLTMVSVEFSDETNFIELLEPIWVLTVVFSEIWFSNNEFMHWVCMDAINLKPNNPLWKYNLKCAKYGTKLTQFDFLRSTSTFF